VSLDGCLDAIAGVPVERDAPMAKRTTFGIGGPADALVTARSEDEVVQVLRAVRDHDVPLFLLGGGSNLLVGDRGVRGVVLTLRGELAAIEVREGGAVIATGAASTFPRLTRTAIDLGWPPAIGWIGTPGQVGGALKMNAGSREGEIGDCVVEVRVATTEGVEILPKAACGFSYRSSRFPPETVLTSAILRCDAHRSEKARELDRVAKEKLNARHKTQPKLRSAGSIFKNPEGDYAGRLIEAAGLKGMKRGNASISDVHANFVVNHGGASAADVVWLAEQAQAEVKARFDVDLQWEVKRVGEFA
jgi:UDP-N-acetylmuramate dehydrogenase